MKKTFRHSLFYLGHDPRLAFFVRSTGYFQLIPPDRECCRIADFCEIFWCIKGRAVFRTGQKEFTLKPGYAWYYPTGSLHDFQPREEGFLYRWLTIAGKGAPLLFEGLAIKPGLNYAGTCPQHLFSLVEMNMEQNNRRQDEMQALAAAFQILTMLSPGQHQTAPRGGIAEEAKALIKDGFSNPDFNVEKIAALLDVHRGSLSRAFSSGYGMSLSHYLRLCRLRHAIGLLRETDLSVKEIARLSGFTSHEYFTRIFSSNTGYTPGSFRTEWQKNRISEKNYGNEMDYMEKETE